MQEQTRSLAELGLTAKAGREVRVTGLSIDSRKVLPGHLFAALPGSAVHGAAYIATALQAGAGAILTDQAGALQAQEALKGSSAAVVVAEDAREALAGAAALWFGAQPKPWWR
jgi:UDP-N-acetylmuramoyl-L-alanyl-D-glutamate--2,6-diaminopimelate ligase